jgi:GNAT superfamily N-acetyltransferase
VIINSCVPKLDGLNEAARWHVIEHSRADILTALLAGMFVLVTVMNGLVQGMGCLDKNEIKRMYVSPQTQGQGIGTRILQMLEAEEFG